MKIGELELAEAIQVYNSYRAKVVAEDVLINYRLSWLLWAEAILFAMWAALAVPGRALADTVNYRFVDLAMLLVTLVGGYVAVGSRISLKAAHDEVDDVRQRYKNKYPELYYSDDAVPRLHSGKDLSRSGFYFGRFMPWIFVVMQGIAAIYTLAAYAEHTHIFTSAVHSNAALHK